jgi:predicted nucleic acid-binding protein
MMKRLKLYLDTSVISHLSAPDTPEKMADTLALWDNIKSNKYHVLISDITFEELSRCSQPKKSLLNQYINEIDFENPVETNESGELLQHYLQYRVLSEKNRDDLRHIALATVLMCDIVVSWNFKHFVNINTINKVQAVNQLQGYPAIKILPPSMITGGNSDE